MDEAVEKMTELDALLCAVTGSTGTDELTPEQVSAVLRVCQRLTGEVLQALRP